MKMKRLKKMNEMKKSWVRFIALLTTIGINLGFSVFVLFIVTRVLLAGRIIMIEPNPIVLYIEIGFAVYQIIMITALVKYSMLGMIKRGEISE